MVSLAHTSNSGEAQFASALLDADAAVPAHLSATSAAELTRRFAIYRNNVVTGLIDALMARFPAAVCITGEEFFAAMARVYITAHPPRSPLIFRYGETMPDFVANFPHASELPYLADVMRIEAARTRAYHAADSLPGEATALAAAFSELAPEDAIALTVNFHPSLSLMSSPHPAVTIWAMNAGDMPLAPIDDWRAEAALVLRPHMEVDVIPLPFVDVAFVETLMKGQSLGEAAAHAEAQSDAFDASQALGRLIAARAILSFSHPIE